MKPSKFRNSGAAVVIGALLTACPFAFAQRPAVVPVPSAIVPRPQGIQLRPALPCKQYPRILSLQEQIQNSPNVSLSEAQQNDVRALACKVNPTVVEVIASGFGAAPGQEYETVAMANSGPSIGSGVIVSSDGFIITNRHVIKGSPRSITVVLHTDGKPDEEMVAELKGQDERTDLALLKINKGGLPIMEMNCCRPPVQQGDTVFAFGSPHGVGNSMTKGIISAPARLVDEKDQVDYIQTDAAINPGNSGGALVDIQGKLVGINTFILSGSGGNEGLNFAIPESVVWYIYNQLKTNGYVVRGDIGVTTRNITPEFIRTLKLPVTVGVYLEDVEPKGPADVAGIEIGDIVVAFDGFPIDPSNPDFRIQLERAISAKRKGVPMRLDVIRAGSTTPKQFTATARQLSPEQSEQAPQLSNDQIISQLGIYGLSIPNMLWAAQHGLRKPQGVIVASKVQTMAAPLSDLQVGDVIHEVNTEPVSSAEDLRQLLDNADSGATLALQVERDGKMKIMFITVN